MEADWLRSRLESGRSIESIAREAGKAASTVAYWVNRHGLTSAHADRHAARGPIDRDVLHDLVERGLSIRQIAAELDRSYSTIQHWLRRHGLSTPRTLRLAETAEARASGADEVQANCRVHGMTLFIRRGRHGFRCRQCRMEAVDRRRREIKRILVAEAGGACMICGYDRSPQALQFHHLEPSDKGFGLGAGGLTRSLERARGEAAKCVLLCGNCHAEVEAGLATIAQTGTGRSPS